MTEESYSGDNSEEYISPIDFSDDTRAPYGAGKKERRASPLSDRRKKDRRRASRFSDDADKNKGATSIDPMNIYLREMGTLSLLSHDEERNNFV